MDYSYIALKLLSEHLGETITVDDTAYESYSFEVIELDMSIIPEIYQIFLTKHSEVMTHLYAYRELIVFILYPYTESTSNQILVGLLRENSLLDYRIISGGF